MDDNRVQNVFKAEQPELAEDRTSQAAAVNNKNRGVAVGAVSVLTVSLVAGGVALLHHDVPQSNPQNVTLDSSKNRISAPTHKSSSTTSSTSTPITQAKTPSTGVKTSSTATATSGISLSRTDASTGAYGGGMVTESVNSGKVINSKDDGSVPQLSNTPSTPTTVKSNNGSTSSSNSNGGTSSPSTVSSPTSMISSSTTTTSVKNGVAATAPADGYVPVSTPTSMVTPATAVSSSLLQPTATSTTTSVSDPTSADMDAETVLDNTNTQKSNGDNTVSTPVVSTLSEGLSANPVAPTGTEDGISHHLDSSKHWVITGSFQGKDIEKTVALSMKYPNGLIPDSLLCKIDNIKLRCDAAAELSLLNKAYIQKFGVKLTYAQGYRSLSEQYAIKASWIARGAGYMAATPGTSNHGLGQAMDFSGPASISGTPQHNWMVENSESYGWIWPYQMRPGGAGPHESWHFDFMGPGVGGSTGYSLGGSSNGSTITTSAPSSTPQHTSTPTTSNTASATTTSTPTTSSSSTVTPSPTSTTPSSSGAVTPSSPSSVTSTTSSSAITTSTDGVSSPVTVSNSGAGSTDSPAATTPTAVTTAPVVSPTP